MNQLSIYERIKSNIGDDGKLSNDFTLNEEAPPTELAYAPGAMDGIGVYHMGGSRDLKTETERIVCLIRKYLKTGDVSLINDIEVALTEHRALFLVDPLLQSIRENKDSIDINKLIEFAVSLVKTSENTELVKLGISFLGLFDLGKYESINNIVAIIALCDEFTLFSVVAASKWSDGTGLIFWIAQRVNGWGKIHAIERLEPETEKIRDWILRNGCSNGVMDAYLGLTCAVKGNLISALRKDHIDDELFDSISTVIGAMLDEGPVDGISEYEHAQEALEQYLRHANDHAFSLSHLWIVLSVQLWAKGAEVDYAGEVLTRCSEIINRPDWREKIINAVRERNKSDFYCACNAASILGIDVNMGILNAIKSEPLEYYPYVQRLFKSADMAIAVADLYEAVLPLDDMAKGMGEYYFADNFVKEHSCLDLILPELALYPLMGVKLIKTGLNSQVVRDRNMACRALSGWVKMLGKPLSDVSPELFVEVKRIFELEVKPDVKARMRKLIDGEYFEDN